MSKESRLPIDYPTASGRGVRATQVTTESSSSGAPNTGDLGITGVHSGRRISRRRLGEIRKRLSDRDLAVLESVDRYRFLTAKHLEALHFQDHASDASAARTCRRVLARLREHRVLGVLDRRIGGIRAGSEGLVYYVDAAGDRLLRGDQPTRKRRRFDEPSARFQDHTLAIADAAVGLIAASRAAGAEVVTVAPEWLAQRHYTDRLGRPQVLRPDLYVELAAHLGAPDIEAFFVEVDLGHESLPTLVGKCLMYEDYRESGVEQRDYGSFPRVIWAMDAYRSTTADRRRRTLQEALHRNGRTTPSLYRIEPLEDMAEHLVGGLSHD